MDWNAQTILADLTIISILLGAAWHIVVRITKVLNSVDDLKKEMKPNGGSSLRDGFNRMEAALLSLDGKVMAHAASDAATHAAIAVRIDNLVALKS